MAISSALSRAESAVTRAVPEFISPTGIVPVSAVMALAISAIVRP